MVREEELDEKIRETLSVIERVSGEGFGGFGPPPLGFSHKDVIPEELCVPKMQGCDSRGVS